jgi:RimJ/RimL family protein N-acetyltransferase
MGRLAFPDPPLQEDGLLLRGLVASDAPAMARAADDPAVLHFAYGDRHRLNEPGYAREFLGGRVADLLRRDSAVMLGVFTSDGSELLGATLLWGLDLERGFGELGYWLGASARGRGVATRAVRATCRWGFDHLGLYRIEALTDPANPASDAVLERVGFAFEGVRRGADKRPDGYHDSRVFSLLRTDG